MLLNKVILQGFLAHRGREIGGEMTPIELDFRDANLWLMHGPNGSGKSSVFDAITFAFFGKARGPQAQLVNDRSDRALIEVEFEAGGTRYLIKRTLKLNKKRDAAATTKEIQRWNAEKQAWEIEQGVGDVGEWVAKTLQVSYENFVSAVVLEQGRADQFLRAPARDRHKQLIDLLNLQVYRDLFDAANERQKASKRIADKTEQRLVTCTPVEADEIEAATAAVNDAQTRVEAARVALENAKRKLGDARLSDKIAAEIADKNALLAQDTELTGETAAIETAAGRREEIGAVLPALNALRGARSAQAEAEAEAAKARQNLEVARATARDLAPELERAKEENDAAAQAGIAAKLRTQESEIARVAAEKDAEILRQIKHWEAQLVRCNAELEPHRNWLNRAEEIESRRTEIDQLTIIAQKIKPLGEARQRFDEAQSRQQQAQKADEQARENLGERRAAAERANAALSQGAEEFDTMRAQQLEVAADLKSQRELRQKREDLGDADECPTCGTTLDDPDACERLQQERQILQREVAQMEAHNGALKSQLSDLEAARKDAMRIEKAALSARDEAVGAASETKAQLESARREWADRKRDLQERLDEAGEWANEDFETIRERVIALDKEHIGAELEKLQVARNAETRSEAVAENCRDQLRDLPNWNEEERAALERAKRDLDGEYEAAQEDLRAAQTAANEAGERLESVQKSCDEANKQVEFAFSRDADKTEAVGAARRRRQTQFDELPPGWNKHKAASDDSALDELRREFDGLQPLAARLGALREAQLRVSGLQGVIAALQAQLEEIPAENRVEPAQAERELGEAQGALQSAEDNCERVKNARDDAQRLRDEWLRCKAERDAAQTEAERYKALEEAFGAKGLQAQIIRQAQERLRSVANGILSRLSNGQWQLDLIGADKDELEIIARDEGRGGYERTFDALSGGERFRVAISLAIAIGQMASGNAPMNTLIIDEGFGALDEENRGLMVDNLRHLSENELKNGRIIVVSHQDDVSEAFDHLYNFSRDEQEYARVEKVVP